MLRHILICYNNFVGVYATSTSLLVRKLRSKWSGIITGCVLDAQNRDHLFVTRRNGFIEKWDWREGLLIDDWRLLSEIFYANTSTTPAEDGLLYTIDRQASGPWLISAHRLTKGGDNPITEIASLFEQEHRISGLRVLEGGKVIAATSGSHLMLGYTMAPSTAKLGDLLYTWRIITCPEWIASFDVLILSSQKKKSLPSVHVVVGGCKGSIFIYDDLLVATMQQTPRGPDIRCRRLHWHRNVVAAVKWSLDGNYVISGGLETVLVIWQLESGQKQHLPHLGAPIENLVVSPKGSAYAIRLADNSAMILSTTDLQPIFGVAGICVPNSANSRHLPSTPTVDMPLKLSSTARQLRYPACISSHVKDQLLLAIPPSRTSSSHQGPLNASSLQTCDLADGRQITRQAMTRTKITDLNFGPESNIIEDPNISHMQTSHDSRWLATVDEWSPPSQDFSGKVYDTQTQLAKQKSRREIHLKFWSWEENNQVWELVSRIDRPHASDFDTSKSSRILALAAHPVRKGFSTMGEDGVVRFWQAVRRTRDNSTVKGKGGKILMNWKCRYSTALGSTLDGWDGGKLAYSSDGSLLAAVPQSRQENSVYLIDALTGGIRNIQTNAATGVVRDIGLASKFLVVLSQRLVVKDLVDMTVALDIQLNLPQPALPSPETHPSSLYDPPMCLTVSHRYHTFAVCVPTLTSSGKTRTTFTLFNSDTLAVLFSTTTYNIINQVLAACSRKAWYLLTSFGEIMTVLPNLSAAVTPGSQLANTKSSNPKTERGVNSFLGKIILENVQLTKSLEASEKPGKDSAVVEQSEEYGKPVISQEQLAEVFEGVSNDSALTMQPLQVLFEQVASLYNGRRSIEA